MVKVRGSHHARSAMSVYVQRRLALQRREQAQEEEELRQQLQAQTKRQLPEFDLDDNGRFAGYDAIFRCEGDNYEVLHRVLKKIMRPAHYRTWAAANSDEGNGPPPCLTAREIAERVGRHRRTIEIDLQEMRKRHLLHLQAVQRDGRWVMEMHYDVLYRLVHEYLKWERSADYIPPERIYFEYMQLAPNLKQQLLQFEDYRKVLGKKKPGPKAKEKPHYHEGLVGHQPYGGDRSQHIYSASPLAPAASQGDMERSIYSESPAPPALPQAGWSGSAHNNATRQPITHKPVNSAIGEQFMYERLRKVEEKIELRKDINSEAEEQATHKRVCRVPAQPITQEHADGAIEERFPGERAMYEHIRRVAEKVDAQESTPDEIAEQIAYERVCRDAEQAIAREYAQRETEERFPGERAMYDHIRRVAERIDAQEREDKLKEEKSIREHINSDNRMQEICQEYTSGSVSQEVPTMPVQVNEFTFKDKMGNSYVYPTSSLPMFFVEVPEDELEDDDSVVKISYYVDKEDILHIGDKYVPFLRDMLICTKSDYDHSHFHHRTAFEPELQRLFDPKAVGVWVAHIPEANEIMMMMEYDPRRNNVNEYMSFLAQDMENILYYQDDDLKKELVPFGDKTISIFEIQEDAVRRYVVPNEPLDLCVEGIWTDDFGIFVDCGHRATRYFIPRIDFPPEVEAAFPDYQVGVWVTMRPGERDAYVQPCYELFMEGIKAKPMHIAIVEARIRYLQTLQPQDETCMSDMDVSTEDASVSAHPSEYLTDEVPIVSAPIREEQANDYACEEQEIANDYAYEEQSPVSNHYEEKTGTTVDITASGEALPVETEVLPELTTPINKADEQELSCDRQFKEDEPSTDIEQQGRKSFSNPIVTGALSKMNLAHRSSSRRIVGNRRGKGEQEPKKSSVFAHVQEMVHDGGIGSSYPAVVPLLQDFMRTKLLGNDTEKRYFIPYKVLKSPEIEDAFPPGTDGVWLWKQPTAQIVHVKPSCMAVDPYLKNRSITVIAVGKVIDDDGYLYFGKTTREPNSKIQQPAMDDYGNVIPEAPLLEQPSVRKTSPPKAQQSRRGEEDTTLEAPPLEAARTGGTSASNIQQSSVDYDENPFSEARPPGQQRMKGMSTSRAERSEANDYGMLSSASPPLSAQQKREQYEALMRRARNGQGKGLQRLF